MECMPSCIIITIINNNKLNCIGTLPVCSIACIAFSCTAFVILITTNMEGTKKSKIETRTQSMLVLLHDQG